VVFIVRWPGKIKPGTSEALFSQVDILSSLAAMTGQALSGEDAPDSFNHISTLLGHSNDGREWLVEHAANGRLSIIRGNWKYIEPGPGEKILLHTLTETGNDSLPQLYNLERDIGERYNEADNYPEMVNELHDLLQEITAKP
jgi:arylsulfatase A-like enzyme